ncbi:MAG: hypothetical protein ACLSWI_02150 [Candidatus Gastranaerophilaceae bacterium]
MDRLKYFLISILFVVMGTVQSVYADEVLNLSTLVTPQEVSFNTCTKFYSMPADKLFYLTMASINANRFSIDEIQSKTGYILFTAVNKQFLASIVKMDSSRTLLKITPTNNVYYFPPGVVLNIFKYVDVNAGSPVTTLTVTK